MAYTRDDLDRIQAVIAKGELEVQYHDRKVRYRSIAELLAAQTEIVRGLEQGMRRSRVFRIRPGGKGI